MSKSKGGTKERSKSLKRDPSKTVKLHPRMIKIEQTNFWEASGFRVDVERIDDNVQQLELLNKFFTERAEIEGTFIYGLTLHLTLRGLKSH